jgi:uncharacterized protein YfaS (alpha-2-macroglobulin family)
MLIVSKYGEIQLTRGDTAELTVDITDSEGGAYSVKEDDTLTLTVKKNYEDTEPLIKKVVTGINFFHIEPEETKGLDFGKYKYDVQLTTANGDNYTVVADKVFNITREVG